VSDSDYMTCSFCQLPMALSLKMTFAKWLDYNYILMCDSRIVIVIQVVVDLRP